MHGNALLSDPADEVRDPLMRELYEAWLTWSREDLVPKRIAFDPLDFPHHLAFITLFDVEDGHKRQFRVRVCGTEIAEAMGIDTTGRYLAAMPNTSAIEERFNVLCDGKQPYFIANQPVAWVSRRAHVHYDCLALPLSTDGNDVSQILFFMKFD
jgi:hypothetical protein